MPELSSTLTSGVKVRFHHTIQTLPAPSTTVYHHFTLVGNNKTPTATVILQHGFGEYACRYIESFSKLIPSLIGRNYEVYALDLHGHGSSPGSRSIVSVTKAIQDHISLRNLVTSTLQNSTQQIDPKVILIGHSLGGLITTASLVESPTSVAACILTGPALQQATPLTRRFLTGPLSSLFPTLQIKPNTTDLAGLSSLESTQASFLADSNITKRQVSMLLANSALEVAEKIWDESTFETWRTPLLVIHGDRDTYTGHKQSVRFVEQIRARVENDEAESYQCHIVEGGKHEVLNDVDADKYLGMMLEWVDKFTSKSENH